MPFFYVQVWQDINVKRPTAQERVQAPSEGQAVIQVMRRRHLKTADRAWVSRSALESPTVRLNEIIVKGKFRHWKQEVDPLPKRRVRQ